MNRDFQSAFSGIDFEQVYSRYLRDRNLRLYGTPSPAYPSWSVLVTLRMISDATADTMEGSCPSWDEDTASRWLKITSGEHDDGHEKTTRMLLANMCEGVISRGKEQIGVLWKELGEEKLTSEHRDELEKVEVGLAALAWTILVVLDVVISTCLRRVTEGSEVGSRST